jgi:hypothetical protein
MSKVSSSKAITCSKIPVLWGITIYNVKEILKYKLKKQIKKETKR